MFTAVLQKSVTVRGLSQCEHITQVSSDRVWICDYEGNLILTNTTGDTLDKVTGLPQYGYGVHTVTRDSGVIYIDSDGNIIKRSKDKVQNTVIPDTAPWGPLSVYSSPSTGDLLVGMLNTDTDTVQLNRYSNTGQHIQTIQHDNTGQRLYEAPSYITENRNGDVIVSDLYRAVVVTDSRGRHRFSYTGPPSGSRLYPRGICTDALSHILVCDYYTDTVHIIDKDGNYLTQLDTEQHGIDLPYSLSYDDITRSVWVGSPDNNTVNIYRLIYGGDNLTDPDSDDINKVKELKKFLRKEKTTVFHARGILVGCAEAGKTTLLERLRGQHQNVDEVTEYTRGLEVHQHLFIVRDKVLEVADDDSPLKTFIRINSKDLKPDPSSAVDTSDTNEKEGNLELKSTDKSTEVVLYSREEKEEEKVETSISPTEGKEERNTVKTMARVLSSEAQTMVKDEIYEKILSEKEKLPTVSMLDFAGQFAYYACHQIYVTPKAFFILVLDMTKKFEDVVDKEKDNQEGSIFSVWTYKDYLKFWITSIKTFGGKKAPLFLVVTNTESKSSDEIEKYFEEFWKAVPEEDRDWLSESLNDWEYAVGLKTLNDNTKEILESMKKSIVELFADENNTKVELPSSWALMEHLLYEGGWKVLSLGEIWKINSSLPNEYQIKSDEEMTKFLKCFHDNGLLLNFDEVELREHVILDIQWFANAFSKIIADENHITKDCKRKLIKEWKSFNKTGELKDKVIDALWKEEPSYVKHKSEIMPYMEKLQMLVPLESSGAVSEGGMSWYVPCMNKKQFKADFSEDVWECSSILCYRFSSFAMFVFYRLVAYCISSLRWSVAKDEDNEGSPCLYQTAAVFDHNEHTVVVGICNDDIQLQVLRIKPLTIDKEVSNEIGDSFEKAIEKLTETFIDNKIFHRGYKCQNIICNEKDLSFNLAIDLSKIKAKEIQCKCQLREKHVINVETTLGFWEKREASDSPVASGQILESRSRFAKLGMATNYVLNKAYRDILESEVPPCYIESKVNSLSTKKRRDLKLNPDQEDLFKKAKNSGYKDFDISFTYKMIRNICLTIPKPTKGEWGKEPAAGEMTVGDDIERIRSIRNRLTAHVSLASIPQTEFDDNWSTMSDVCQRLETFTGKKYLNDLNSIEKLTLRREDEDAIIKNFKMQEILEKMKSNVLEFETMLKPKEASELSTIKAKEIQWKCQLREKHVINVETTLGFWEKNPVKDAEAHKSLSSQRNYTVNKETLILEFWNWLTKRYKDLKIVRLYLGEEKFGKSRKVIVLVIDDFKVIEETKFEYSRMSFSIVCKLYKFPSLEGAYATNREQNSEADYTLLSMFGKCIRDISNKLFEKHSNLEIISASNYRSKKNGDEIIREPCIVLYCACKGVIPIEESEFPTSVSGIKTDVREGFFYQFPNDGFFKRSTDVLDPLMMGASISSKDFPKGGTLGGFVTLNTGDIGFITCAHVLFNLSSQCDETKQFDVVQPAYAYKNTNDVCGVHELSCFPTTTSKGCTLDVSLVRLNARIPERGLFSDLSLEDLLENGFTMENLPEYSEGTIRDYREDHFAHQRDICFKWGAKTGLTKGALRLNGTSVRWYSDVIRLDQPPSQCSFVYHSQLEILGTGTSFALPGDSGALVFQLDSPAAKEEQHRFHCIGMVVGGTSDNKTIITPIGPILEALKVKMHTFSQEKMDES